MRFTQLRKDNHMLNLQDPRGEARALIEQSVQAELWRKNRAFTDKLAQLILSHRLYSHDIITAWKAHQFSLESIQKVHLETRHGLINPFMDSLLKMMVTSGQVEHELGPEAKVAARFLILLNIIDETGFAPTSKTGEMFNGHPLNAHYSRLTECMDQLGLPPEIWADHIYLPETLACKATLEDNQNDHLRLAVVLACIETVFMPYYGPWAQNTMKVCPAVNVVGGYHTIHIEEDDGHHIDDDHSEDSWYIVRQALQTDRYNEIEQLVRETLDIWAALMDRLLNHHLETSTH